MGLLVAILVVASAIMVIQGVTVMDEVVVGVGMVLAIIALFGLLFTGRGKDAN